MGYFAPFPLLYYKTDKKSQPKLVADILRRIVFRRGLNDITDLFLEYIVEDSDTPETIAEKIYEDANLYWVIMLHNNMLNRFLDFPLSQKNLNKYITNKYGAGNEDKIHHYEDENGEWVNGAIFLEDSNEERLQDSSGDYIYSDNINISIGLKIPVSNRQYEIAENEKKRGIKILDPQYLGDVVREFEQKINL